MGIDLVPDTKHCRVLLSGCLLTLSYCTAVHYKCSNIMVILVAFCGVCYS